jgi:uncharacterized protein YbbK (DUF523 family)
MHKVLVSACLLGERVRYDAGDVSCHDDLLRAWAAEGRLIPVCPEVAGGLGVPRPPAQIRGGGGGAAVLAGAARVATVHGDDVTDAFLAGAEVAVATARRHGIRVAILKEHSPSCGATRIHDGTFTGVRVPGLGVAAAALRAAGVDVFPESEVAAAARRLAELDEPAPS